MEAKAITAACPLSPGEVEEGTEPDWRGLCYQEIVGDCGDNDSAGDA